MEFHYWSDSLSLIKKQNPSWRRYGVEDGYDRLERMLTKPKDVNNLRLCQSERSWHRLGKPYFKVWPTMAAALSNVRMDIGGACLNLPFNTYEVRLPVRNNPVIGDDGLDIKGILVDRLDNCPQVVFQSPRDWTLAIHTQINTPEKARDSWYCCFPIRKDETLEDQIEGCSEEIVHRSNGKNSVRVVRMVVRLAISVAFFGIDRHELVAPDIPKCYQERYRKVKQDRNDTEEAEVLKQAKRMGMFGWRIGSEVDLPLPEVRYLDSKNDGESHGGLTYGHIRRAHMRLQPCGQGNKDRRLQFIPQAFVRPDLPLAETHGFRIGRPPGSKV